MSNRRKPGIRGDYRSEFLHSPAWLARRARWFRKQERLGRPLACAGCGQAARMTELELHHLDYSGVKSRDGSWRAFERHDDLQPLHAFCHSALHRIIEHDRVLSYHRSRRVASAMALKILRSRFVGHEETP